MLSRLFRHRKQISNGAPQPSAAAPAEQAEAETVVLIKTRCDVGKLFAARLSDPNEDHAAQWAYYDAIRSECITAADRLDDEFHRGFAIHCVIDLCMAAGEVAVAKALLVAVQDRWLREKIFETTPTLRAD